MGRLQGKAYAKILEHKCRLMVEPHIQNEKCGFLAGHGTTDQIFTLQQIIEKSWEFDWEVYLCFIDLEKGYDRVPRVILLEALEEYGVGGQLLSAIKSLYAKCESRVRV